MALPLTPPKYASFKDIVASIRPGENGWRAYSLQRALLTLGYKLPAWGADGAYSVGGETLTAVQAFQRDNRLVVDGIVGPATQGSLLGLIERLVHASMPTLPEGVLRGFTFVEGAGVLAATNWSVAGGVDCGPVQWRVLSPFKMEKTSNPDEGYLKGAFDVRLSYEYAGRILLQRIADYNRRNPGLSDETVLRAALLAHNWPAGADQIVRLGHLNTPNALATWTLKPDGTHYTHQEWFMEYTNRILAYVP